jgi:transposase
LNGHDLSGDDRVHFNFLSGHVYTMEDHIEVQLPRRRRHSAEFKAEVVSACMRPGVSTAAVALHYRINANLLRRWVTAREAKDAVARSASASTNGTEFVPVPLIASTQAPAQEIVLEVRRGATAITMRWPVSAAHDCAQWLQGWLR